MLLRFLLRCIVLAIITTASTNISTDTVIQTCLNSVSTDVPVYILFDDNLDPWTNNQWHTAYHTNTPYTFFTNTSAQNEHWKSLVKKPANFRLKNQITTYFSMCTIDKFSVNINSRGYYGESFNLPHDSTENNELLIQSHTSNCQWFHYEANLTDNELRVKNGNITAAFKSVFHPYWISSKNSKDTTIQLSNRAFKESFTISNQNENNFFNLYVYTNTCLSMFVSVELDCYLNITLVAGNKTANKIVNGSYSSDQLKEWKYVEISIQDNNNSMGMLHLNRGCFNNKSCSYWAIGNIKFCSHKKTRNKFELERVLSSEDIKKLQMCAILNADVSEMDIFGYRSTLTPNVGCSEDSEGTESHPSTVTTTEWDSTTDLEMTEHQSTLTTNKEEVTEEVTEDLRMSPEQQQRPENLQLFWTLENEAVLSWSYPTINKTQIQYFIILVFEISDASKKSLYNITMRSTLKYKHKIQSDIFLPSTKYNFTVGVHNNSETYNSIEDTSPPKIPSFEPAPQIVCSKSSLVVKISPQIGSKDRNSIFEMTVLINHKGKYSMPEDLQEFEKSFYIDLSKLKVLYQRKVNKSNEAEIFVGASCKPNDKYNNINYVPLEEGITIILNNTDDNKSSYKLYFYEQQTLMSSRLSLLVVLLVLALLLVMLGVLILMCKKYSVKKRNGATEEIALVSSAYEKTNLYQPIKTEHFENYVKDGIENKIFPEQYKKILRNVSSDCYERAPGNFLWDYIDMNVDQEQQIKKTFIISELPSDQNSEELWRFIWKDKVENIILVTDIYNNQQQEMVKKHFPKTGNSVRHGKFTIRPILYKRYSDHEQQTFEISYQQINRQINLLSYISWTNNSVVHSFSVTPFLQKMMLSEMSKSPVVVLSSGDRQAVGFILLCHITLKNEKTFGSVDIVKTFSTFLKYNINITERQYILAHLVVLENLMYVDTTIDCQPFDISAPNLKNEDINVHLQHMKKVLWIDHTIKRLQQEGKEEKAVIYNPEIEHEYTYIDNPNPVMIDGLLSRSKFSTTPKPGIHSLSNFWKLVIDKNVKVIISLNETSMPENELWWSSEDIQLEIEAAKPFKNYTWVTVSIEVEEIQKKVELFLVKNWSKQNDCPDSVIDFVDFFIETNKISKNSNPILVTCCDGTKASGLYVALSYIAEKISFEGICDICSAVRFVKSHHSEFLKSDVQFSFLWEAVEVFLREIKTYETVY